MILDSVNVESVTLYKLLDYNKGRTDRSANWALPTVLKVENPQEARAQCAKSGSAPKKVRPSTAHYLTSSAQQAITYVC